MEHLQLAYDLLVIMIGLAALSIVVFWAVRTGEADLRDFSLLYLCFTLVLIVRMLKGYLFVNVESYSARAWYGLSGAEQILGFAVLIAAIHFFTGFYQVHQRAAIMIAFLVVMFVCSVLLFSPSGARLEADTGTIHFGITYKIVALSYFATFTFMLA